MMEGAALLNLQIAMKPIFCFDCLKQNLCSRAENTSVPGGAQMAAPSGAAFPLEEQSSSILVSRAGAHILQLQLGSDNPPVQHNLGAGTGTLELWD